MGFLDGIRDVVGGFNAVKRIDDTGFDWREQDAAQQFARDRQVEEARQSDEDRAVNQIADAYAGAEGGQEPDVSPLLQGIEERRQKFMLDRARGVGKERKSALEDQRRYREESIAGIRGRNALDVTAARGDEAQEAIQLREKLARERTLSPADQARLNALEKMNADRIAAGDRRSASGGSSRRPTKVGGVDDQGRAGTWLIYPDQSREFMPAAATAGTRGKEESKAAAMQAYTELMDEYDSMGGQPEDGLEARATGLYRTGAGKLGYDPATSTYQAGVRGFVPLMARALGHVGVLTELDVERTEALFPKAGDTLAEKTRKKRLLTEIMVGARPMPFKFERDTRDGWGPNGEPPQRPGGGGEPPQPPAPTGGTTPTPPRPRGVPAGAKFDPVTRRWRL